MTYPKRGRETPLETGASVASEREVRGQSDRADAERVLGDLATLREERNRRIVDDPLIRPFRDAERDVPQKPEPKGTEEKIEHGNPSSADDSQQ